LLKGEPAHVIDRLAATRGIDLIVMATILQARAFPGFSHRQHRGDRSGRVRLGSVLAVKPDGFVSPVKLDEAETITT